MIPRTIFSQDHELFRSIVRQFVTNEVTPYHQQWEKAGIVPRDLWRRAGDAGLLCCDVPAQYGGQGAGFLFSLVVMEELARAGASGPFFHLHSDIVAPYLLRYGTESQKQRWLPSMSSGQVIGAIAITEPGGGSDVQSIQMSASRTPEGYSLRGQKVFVSNGQLADLVIVAAQTERGSGASGLTLFLVEGDRVGLRRGRNLEKIGLKAQDTSELFFDDVIVPERNVLGETGKGFIQLMTELAQERLIQAVRAVSTAEAAIDWTIDYTTQRRAFGRAIAEFQNTEFKLAELSSLITGQRVFADRCIELHLAHQLDAADAARLKLTSTELLGKVTDECLQLFGGWGYMWEYPIARAYADARQARIAAGSSEIMKQIIARDLRRRERHAK